MEILGPFYDSKECCNPLCCEVYKVCDCECISCVADYIEYVMNRVQREHLGITADEVEKAGGYLMGFAVQASYWRIKDPKVSDEPLNTFGRTYVYSAIKHRNVKPDTFRVSFREVLRILDIEQFEGGKEECGCAEKQQCNVVKELFNTMRTFLEIGGTGNPPYTIEEWHMALCGICYDKCGERIVYRTPEANAA